MYIIKGSGDMLSRESAFYVLLFSEIEAVIHTQHTGHDELLLQTSHTYVVDYCGETRGYH